MSESKSGPIEILLVEDNEGDAFLTQIAFEQAKLSNNIQVAKDGEEALKLIKKIDQHKDAASPDLILLDINMPKKNGIEVLKELKNSDEYKRIPVIMLTSSTADQDIVESYGHHANGYIVKPVDVSQLQQVVSAIEDFWFSVIILPSDISKNDK